LPRDLGSGNGRSGILQNERRYGKRKNSGDRATGVYKTSLQAASKPHSSDLVVMEDQWLLGARWLKQAKRRQAAAAGAAWRHVEGLL